MHKKPHSTQINSLILLFIFILSFSSFKKTESEEKGKSPEQWEIIIYGISDCIYCTGLEDELDKENNPYTFYDINTNNAKRGEMLDKLAADGIPNSTIHWPVVNVITDGVSHIFIQPSLEDYKFN